MGDLASDRDVWVATMAAVGSVDRDAYRFLRRDMWAAVESRTLGKSEQNYLTGGSKLANTERCKTGNGYAIEP